MTKYNLRFGFPNSGFVTLHAFEFPLGLCRDDRVLSVGPTHCYSLGQVSGFVHGVKDEHKQVIAAHIDPFGGLRRPPKDEIALALSELKSVDGLIASIEGTPLRKQYDAARPSFDSQLDPMERLFVDIPHSRRSVSHVPIAASLGYYGYAVLPALCGTGNIVSGSEIIYNRHRASINLGGVERYVTLSLRTQKSPNIRYVLVCEPWGEINEGDEETLRDALSDLKSLGKPLPLFFSTALGLAALFKKVEATATHELLADTSWVDEKMRNR